MSRTIWLNGTYVAQENAQIPIFDRGLLFADAVYEGLGILDGQIIDWDYHMSRLRRSLGELSMPEPMSEDALRDGLYGLITREATQEGFLYLHITRGVEERDYVYGDNLRPNVFAFIQAGHDAGAAGEPVPLRLASTPDLRWARRDIKTSNLLGQVLAKVAADQAGADEALMLDNEGYVTEAGSMSFFPIINDVIHARPLERDLLPGVTRRTMLEVAQTMGLGISDARYTLADVLGAQEAFVTASSSYVQPVSHVDGQAIGDGTMGPITRALRAQYLVAIREKMKGS